MKRGVDVSHHQGLIDWNRPKIDFAYIRAKYGLTDDTQFANNWAGAKQAGIKRGAYLYFLCSINPHVQGLAFYDALGGDLGELPPALDLEYNAKIDGIANKPKIGIYANQALAMLVKLEELFKIKPVIYTNPSTIQTYLQNPLFSQYPLWIAHPKERAPLVPLPFWAGDWYAWQFSWNGDGKYYGAASRYIDLDVMNDQYDR